MDEQTALDLGGVPLTFIKAHAIAVPAPPAWAWAVWVPGVPAPQGSKKAFVVRGRAIMKESSSVRLTAWRRDVVNTAVRAWPGPPITVPVVATFGFVLPPWKGTKPGDLPVGSKTGDLDKLIRAVGDALTTAQVWTDDRLVVGYGEGTAKRFAAAGEDTGCRIHLRPAGPPP